MCYNGFGMKRLIIILTFFLIFINGLTAEAASKFVTKEIKVQASDGYSIVATFQYPNEKQKMEFPTVVLLHSLGYSSTWWETLPQDLLNNGYAVLAIDLRGHGKSVYNSQLVRTSWTNMKNKSFVKYPDDVLRVIEYVKTENKRKFFDDWAIVGSDIGACTAVYVANKISYKPKTLVLLSPLVSAKSLYVPVKLAELSGIDVLNIVGNNDSAARSAYEYLKKFAQSTFALYKSESKVNGMLMLKNDPELSTIITGWISQYLK
jgi:pimeloyl-ACP methyl ester carboxylesterase